jgi:hypothetical protein
MDLTEANAIVQRFGAEHQRAVLSERRDRLTSALFDVPRRSSLGNVLYYEHLGGLLRDLLTSVTPEEIGRLMKRPGSRPYALSLWVVLGAYLSGRQQVMLDRGLPPGEPIADDRVDDLLTVVEFFARVARVYREDGSLFPEPGNANQTILTPETTAEVLATAGPPDEARLAAVRRGAASLTLYNFMQHGEQRDGVFGHGPYAGPDGATVWFEEFNDLRNDLLPWSTIDAPALPVPNVVFAHAAKGVEVEANMFGAMRVTPLDLEGRLELVTALTYGENGITPLANDELEAIAACADARQAAMFQTAYGWSDDFRVEYGAVLFANHLIPFFDLAGRSDGRELVLERFSQTAAAGLAPLLSDPEIPSFWHHLGTVQNDRMYTPAQNPEETD